MDISIVSPIYMGDKMLDELVRRIKESVSSITSDYEIILVNDCSPDNSWSRIKEICRKDPYVKAVNLSRNFGQHYAITAGLSVAQGKWIVVMDCDLQDQPEEIPRLYKKALEGYDTVLGQRVERKDKFLKRLSSTLFNKVFAYLTDSSKDKTIANFGIYNKKVIAAVLQMGDLVKSFPTEVNWVGFKTAKLPVEHASRASGSSSYTLKKLFAFAFNNMIAFSNKPLRLMVVFGFCIVLLSFLIAAYYFVQYMTGKIGVSGFSTLVISIWLSCGLIIMFMGMVGVYIGKIFDQVKGRPTFIISEKLNFDDE